MYKHQFPIFTHHPDLIYLDNAATVQKPQYVLDETTYFLTHEYANIHRWTYPLALAAEEQRNRARHTVAAALQAPEDEVVFTHHATHSSNLLAHGCLLAGVLQPWDIILVWLFDHHANIAPRQLVAERSWAILQYIGFDPVTRQYDWSFIDNIPLERLKVISLSLVSNVTGEILDLSFVKELSKNCQIRFFVDASQAIPHMLLDLPKIGADGVYFTGHKLWAFTGIGVLWGTKEFLSVLSPVFVWWWAIDRVTKTWHTYQSIPDKFEPGTPNVLWAVSLRAAFEWIASLHKQPTGSFHEQLMHGYDILSWTEQDLISFCRTQFGQLQDAWLLIVIGSLTSTSRIWLFSRSLPTGNINKLGYHLGDQGISIRTGAHCTHPLHAALGLEGTARMSLRAYNDMWDLQIFFSALRGFLEDERNLHSS
jgi:cysteine desulfurase / selenocysteine lyase